MKILLPVLNKRVAEVLLPFAHAMLEGGDGEILLVGVVVVPTWKSLSEGAGEAQQRRLEIRDLLEEHPEMPLRVLGKVHVSHVPWTGVLEDISREKVDLIVFPWPGAREAFVLGERQDESGVEKYPVKFEIDELRCVYCGLCVEACPCDAIRMDSGIHMPPVEHRYEAILSREDLLSLGGPSVAPHGEAKDPDWREHQGKELGNVRALYGVRP
jgi:ferredoxin